MIITRSHSVIRQQANTIGQIGVIGRNNTAIAKATKILGGVEAETTHVANAAGLFAFVRCSN